MYTEKGTCTAERQALAFEHCAHIVNIGSIDVVILTYYMSQAV